MNRKIIFIVVLLLAILALFAACGENGSTGIPEIDSLISDKLSTEDKSTSEPETPTSASDVQTTEPEEQTYTVAFNSNGGSAVSPQKVEIGKKALQPADPEKAGYTFEGWTYQNETWSFIGYSVTENMTLEANWVPIVYDIIYELNDGTNAESNPATYTIESETISFANPMKAGYHFTGWDIPTIPSGSTGNKTVTATWATIFTVSDNSITGLTDVGKQLSAIDIPSKIDGVTITSIGNSAFNGCSRLTTITIPNSVTSIGGYAFRNCSRLTSITIPNDVKSIEGGVFWGCSGLKSITIPNSVTSIGGSAFYDCSSLTSIMLPNSVTSIGYAAFWGCSKLQYNEYNNAKFLGNESNPYLALIEAKDKSITSCTVSETTKFICESAFSGCSNLTSVTIPNSVTSIGKSAFEGCSGLTSVTIPNSVTSIEENAFFGCSGLKSITIPNSVKSIGRDAFFFCGLTSITIPDSVTSIGDDAFCCCVYLKSVSIGKGVTSIGRNAFVGCEKLQSVSSANTNGWYVTQTYGASSGINISLYADYLKGLYSNYYWYRK